MKATRQEIERFERKLTGKSGGTRVRKNIFLTLAWLSASAERFIEIVFSAGCLTVFGAAALAALSVRKALTGKDIFERKHIFGAHASKLPVRYFNLNIRRSFLRKAPLLWHVLTGRMCLAGVGPREWSDIPPAGAGPLILSQKPSVFSVHSLRESGKIAHGNREETETEYLHKKRFFSGIMIVLKSIPVSLYNSAEPVFSDRVNILDVEFDNLSMAEAVGKLEAAALEKRKITAFFINPDCLNKSRTDHEYKEALAKADYVFPDGSGVNIACQICGTPLKSNINGTDMLPRIVKMCMERDLKIFLLGAKPGTAEKMRDNLAKKWGRDTVAGCHHGYFDRQTENDKIIRMINESGADILLTAFGAPAQEKWTLANRGRLSCPAALGVGGLFDFYSGAIKRAPVWMRETGLEWIYRLIQEPARMWRRYIIGNPVFLARVIVWNAARGGGEKNGP
jgi:N-acetylglucosaminyldiphosphoundecaprenol N-acetyl-beta-D-mannosaminyltransferase